MEDRPIEAIVRSKIAKQKPLKARKKGVIVGTKGRKDIVVELGEPTNLAALLQRVLDCPVSSFTIWEVISNCPSLLSFVFPDTYPKPSTAPSEALPAARISSAIRVSFVDIEEHTMNLVYAALTPKLKVKINGDKLTYALLDTGAKVNVMTSELAKEVGLAVRPQPYITLIVHGGECRQFDGVCEDVDIIIGGI